MRRIRQTFMMNLIRTATVFAIALSVNEKLAAQCCDHILQMNDSYGDGWNGGSFRSPLDAVALRPT